MKKTLVDLFEESVKSYPQNTFLLEKTDKKEGFTFSSITAHIKPILILAAVLGIIGASICGILIFRERQEERERMIRREKRERRMKDWGYSSTEFDMIMQAHLRSKNAFRKRSFADKLRDFFRRH